MKAKILLQITLAIVSVLSLGKTTLAQKPELTYKWKIAQLKTQAHVVLELSNNGAAINHKNWGIYLNSIRIPVLKKGTDQYFDIKHINGDLHYIYPNENFKSLDANNIQTIEFATPNIKKYNELPSGFFVVLNDQPSVGYTIKNLNVIPDTIELKVAQKGYHINKEIKDIKEEKLTKVFPTPVNYKEKKGYFRLNDKTIIVTDKAFTNEATLLQQNLNSVLNKKLEITDNSKSAKNTIILKSNTTLGNGYSLEVSTSNIVISAANNKGIFYGIQSLKTLINPEYYSKSLSQINIQAVSVLDSARFGHRALLLDAVRNFVPKSEVLKTLDLMASYKLNTLHFHITDDEGWRLEIPGLPELTEVGAKRGLSLKNDMLYPTYGSGPHATNSNFYSLKDFKEILEFAKARHIKVIPELEMPGHGRAAIKSMDARFEKYMALGQKDKALEYLLSDPNDESKYRTVQGWNDNVMNMARPSTYAFIEKVVGEIVKIYKEVDAPLETIHMGGDEVPKGVWTASPLIEELKAQNPDLKDVNDLWRYFYTKVYNILKSHNLYLYGWEEIALKVEEINGRKLLVVDSLVMGRNYQTDVWNNIMGTGSEDLAYRMANAGTKVVLSNVTNMYIDMAYNNGFHEPGVSWGGFINIDKPFNFIPYDYFRSIRDNEEGDPVAQSFFNGKKRLDPKAKNNIVGLQTAIWTETILDTLTLEYLLFPRLLSFAERAWAKNPEWANIQENTLETEAYKNAYSEFMNTLSKRELPRLDHTVEYKYRIPEVGVLINNGFVEANSQYPGYIIRYTTDGTIPTEKSSVYTKPLSHQGEISLRIFNKKGRGGKTVVVKN
jgi:hexosaminidase